MSFLPSWRSDIIGTQASRCFSEPRISNIYSHLQGLNPVGNSIWWLHPSSFRKWLALFTQLLPCCSASIATNLTFTWGPCMQLDNRLWVSSLFFCSHMLVWPCMTWHTYCVSTHGLGCFACFRGSFDHTRDYVSRFSECILCAWVSFPDQYCEMKAKDEACFFMFSYYLKG